MALYSGITLSGLEGAHMGCQGSTRVNHVQGKYPSHCAVALAQHWTFCFRELS